MSGSDQMRQFIPLPTQFLQEEEPSDIDEEDEQDAEYNQPLAKFRRPGPSVSTVGQDRTVQSSSAGSGISTASFYGVTQRNMVCFGNITSIA